MIEPPELSAPNRGTRFTPCDQILGAASIRFYREPFKETPLKALS
jgi:hypothetical protein